MSSDSESYDSEIDDQQQEIIQRRLTEKDDDDDNDPVFRYEPDIVGCHFCSFQGKFRNYKKHILRKHPTISKEHIAKNVAEVHGNIKSQRKEMRQRLKNFFRGTTSKCFLCGRSNRGVKMREHLTNVHGLEENILQCLTDGKFLSSMGCWIRSCQICGKKYVCQKEKVVSSHSCHKPVPKTKVNVIII